MLKEKTICLGTAKKPVDAVDMCQQIHEYIKAVREQTSVVAITTLAFPLPPLEIEPPPPRNRKLEKTWFKKFERK